MMVTRATKNDLKDVLNMALATHEIHTQKGDPEYYSLEQLEGFIENPDSIFLVVRDDNKLAGFRLATIDRFAKEAYLINLVVAKDYRHRGIGQLLYKKTLEELEKRGCLWAWVLVHENNKTMQNFLEKQDFERGPKFVYFRKTLGMKK